MNVQRNSDLTGDETIDKIVKREEISDVATRGTIKSMYMKNISPRKSIFAVSDDMEMTGDPYQKNFEKIEI